MRIAEFTFSAPIAHRALSVTNRSHCALMVSRDAESSERSAAPILSPLPRFGGEGSGVRGTVVPEDALFRHLGQPLRHDAIVMPLPPRILIEPFALDHPRRLPVRLPSLAAKTKRHDNDASRGNSLEKSVQKDKITYIM